MDAWCALWFWPVDKAGLLDGSDGIYATEPLPEPDPVVDPAPVDPAPVFPTDVREGVPLRRRTGTAHSRRSSPPQVHRRRNPSVVRRAQVPLKDFEDWLEFAESLLGRQDIPADSLARHFTTLSDLSGYEDQLAIYMGMDPFYRLAERFPWLDTVVDIADAQGFFHWELRFAQVFADGGFDLQVGNPPWVRPRWDENVVLAEFEPWFELSEKSANCCSTLAEGRIVAQPSATEAFFLSELTADSRTQRHSLARLLHTSTAWNAT